MQHPSFIDQHFTKNAQRYIASACCMALSIITYFIADRILYARAQRLGRANPLLLNDYIAHYNDLPLWQMLLAYAIPLVFGAMGLGLFIVAIARHTKYKHKK